MESNNFMRGEMMQVAERDLAIFVVGNTWRPILNYDMNTTGRLVIEEMLKGRDPENHTDLEDVNQPLMVFKEVNIEEWKRAKAYNDEQINELKRKILMDYGLEINEKNMEWLEKEIYGLINEMESDYKITLPENLKRMLLGVILRILYDTTCIEF